jgi:hypothetical protein
VFPHAHPFVSDSWDIDFVVLEERQFHSVDKFGKQAHSLLGSYQKLLFGNPKEDIQLFFSQ